MNIGDQLTDRAVLEEVGRRIARTRLERNVTQAEVAAEAGVGVATVQRLERGSSVASTSLIRILRVLGLLAGLERALPEALPSPLEQLKRHGRTRRRAARPRQAGDPQSPWQWGDETTPGGETGGDAA